MTRGRSRLRTFEITQVRDDLFVIWQQTFVHLVANIHECLSIFLLTCLIIAGYVVGGLVSFQLSIDRATVGENAIKCTTCDTTSMSDTYLVTIESQECDLPELLCR